eukprot:NODE_11087_length_1309_cov_3.314721.p1 GENE.NODE_11087_length_1309_cov_3.314721~~NODE_11087_length_1309_cov_3.314721.p1  ORF type:complete len:275 (-),score=95.52 NODE_11087_length_1309_cov_3.314721:313-1137(-)
MHNDEAIWACLSEFTCSFKVKKYQPQQDFCRNRFNVTGICSRPTCPLANGTYATVLEEEGICYLYMKTIERAHQPRKLWERVKLSRNFLQALEQINKHLEYWPQHMVNRCKQRLTKMRQMLVRTRRLALRELPATVPIKKKLEKRERTREIKAERAANVDVAIEKELLERLKQGTYGDIYNFPRQEFEDQLGTQAEEEDEEEIEYVEDLDDDDLDGEDLSEDETIKELEAGFMPDLEELGGASGSAGAPQRKRSRHAGLQPRVEIEYEDELDAH